MNEIQTKILRFANLRHKSINHCLHVLGASWDEVYNMKPNGQGYIGRFRAAQNRSIYEKYSRPELMDWATHLYRTALIEYHPDKHPENPRLYTEICQELGKAYLQAKKILHRGKHEVS